VYEELQATSDAGRHYVALMEKHAQDFAERAPKHDREGSFPFENFEEMQRSRVMAAMVPQQFGGLGVESAFDMIVGIARLGRADGSTAIAANMQIASGLLIRMEWESARAAGDKETMEGAESFLRNLGTGEITLCLLGSEAGTDQLHPQVTATRTEGGYLINGRKIFGTLSPMANMFYAWVAVESPNGGLEIAPALLPRGIKGMEIQDNWDAMGMRASGSNDVVFKDCFVPDEQLGTKRQAYGEWSAPWFNTIVLENLGLASVFFGIAEAARDYTITQVQTRRKKPSDRTLAERPTIQHWIAEIEIDLHTAEAVLEKCARRVDEFYRVNPPGTDVPLKELHQLNKLFQITKNVVTGRAVAIVDKAMTATGGSGYLNKSPLSRWYRDVRAGPIMQTYSPNEQYEYIARATLGLPMKMTN
jgi:alkylation response protein AidB-like acyl-CoA dehydrogenase